MAARNAAFTLASAAAGGAIFHFLGIPAAWLTGSMFVILALAVARAPIAMPDPLRMAVFVLIGLQIGSGFTPDMMDRVAKWPISLLGLGVAVVLVIVTAGKFLTSYSKWSRTTAFYAAIPGALSYVLALSSQSTADVRLVMFAQMLRLVSLLAILPIILTVSLAPPALPAQPTGSLAEIGLQLACALPVALFFERRGFPAGAMLAGMAASSALHFFGVVSGQLPWAILIPCQIGIGANIGIRFIGTDLAFIRRAIAPAFGSFVIALTVSSLVALIVAWSAGLPAGQVIVAFAPGGIEAMTLMAIVLGLDPAFVATHQLSRFIGISIVLPIIAKVFLGKAPNAPSTD